MSLKPIRQVEQTNIDYITPWTQERGGILSYGSASGMVFAEYSFEASGVIPIGIQLNDIEHMNLSRHYHRQYRNGQNTDVPCGIVGVATQGDFETDWVHINGTVEMGDAAYVGHSGTITNNSALGGIRVGSFIGVLKADPHQVTMRGLGFSRQLIDPCTKDLIWENNPADRTLVLSDGFIKVRIDSNTILKDRIS